MIVFLLERWMVSVLCKECVKFLYDKMSDNELLVLTTYLDPRNAIEKIYNQHVKNSTKTHATELFISLFLKSSRSTKDVSEETGLKMATTREILNHFRGMGIVSAARDDHTLMYQLEDVGKDFMELLTQDKLRFRRIYSRLPEIAES